MAEKFYSLRNDFMFHIVFQKNERALKSLVAALMGLEESEIRQCVLENPIRPGMVIDDKSCTLDILLTLNDDRRIDIEMQVDRRENWRKRSLFYWSRMYSKLHSGEDYRALKPAVQIGILNFTLFEKEPEFYAEYKLLNVKTHRPFSEDLSIRILDLTQLERAIPEKDDELKKWAMMFRANSPEELEEASKEKEVFRDMAETMGVVTLSDEYWSLMDGREKYKWDLTDSYETGKKEGIAQGIDIGKKDGVDLAVKQLAAALGKDENELRKCIKDIE